MRSSFAGQIICHVIIVVLYHAPTHNLAFLFVSTDQHVKMPHSFGYRARTRHMFAKKFKHHGQVQISRFLRSFHAGDIVDIVADSGEQKGMPHKYYQGRTGVVYAVYPRAVGIIIYKTVGNRKIEKRVSLRVEHVRHSKCRDDFVNRVKSNAEKKRIAQEKGETLDLKRHPAMPREAHTISQKEKPVTLVPQAYDTYI